MIEAAFAGAAARGAEAHAAPRHGRSAVRTRRVGESAAGTHFVAGARAAEACAELVTRRFVVARTSGTIARGDLRRAIDDAVEGALAMRGALPPAVNVEERLELVVSDQAFRARALGAAGLSVVIPRLPSEDGVVSGSDAETLAVWLDAARAHEVALLFDERDRGARLTAPVRLEELARSVDRKKPTFTVVERVARELMVEIESPIERPASMAELEPLGDADPSPAPPSVAIASATRRVVDAAEWRQHAMELERARGPRPVAAIEKLFVAHYAPLLGALARGEADGAVRQVVDTWRTSFEHSWKEAFSAVRVTGKRPPMVFDAFEIAGRIGRLNGARAGKLVLVDAMRFDLGERVEARLNQRLAGHAVCVEKMLLWSALPTTTPAQMVLLGRGADGLKELPPDSEPEPDVSRGRAVATIRRERVGTREIGKLDLVEARLRGQGPTFDVRLDAIADEVADTLARFLGALAPRTLAFVFGDHGFRIGPTLDGRGTTGASQGGLSPEEVLVPAQAWLVGGVH